MDIQGQFNLVAKSYDENRKKFIPCFDDYYISSTDFIARTLNYEPKLIYDLGSGTGLLSSFWYRHFPKSEYVLIDIAEEMLDVAKKRFSGSANIKYKVLDYSESMPEGNPDLIISALSIHHLENTDKKRLFKRVYESLEDDRLFVNYDQFCSDSSVINEKIEEYWINGIKKSGVSEIEYARWIERKKTGSRNLNQSGNPMVKRCRF